MPSTILSKLKNEPAMLVATVLAFLAYFGVRLSEDDASALSQVVTAVGPLVAGVLIRRFVTPEASAREREEAAALNAYIDIDANDH